MKCPHCSYVSFDYLDSCRKCSKDLTAHKSTFGIDYLEPIAIGVLAHVSQSDVLASTSIEESDMATATAFETDDFAVGGDTSDTESIGETEIGDVFALNEDQEDGTDVAEIEIDETPPAIPEEPIALAEEAEAPEITLDLDAFDEDIEVAKTTEVAEVEVDEVAGEISLDFDEDTAEIEVAETSEVAEIEVGEVAGEISLDFDEEEASEEIFLDVESLDIGALEDGAIEKIEGPVDIPTEDESILDSSLDATASDFSLGLGEDFDTETDLDLDALPPLDQDTVSISDEVVTEENGEILVDALTEEDIGVNTMDDDVDIDVSLDDDPNSDTAIEFDEIDLEEKSEIQTPDIEPAEELDIALDDDALDLNLDDLEFEDDKQTNNDETITEDMDETSLDLQIGDDDLDLDLDLDLDTK